MIFNNPKPGYYAAFEKQGILYGPFQTLEEAKVKHPSADFVTYISEND